MRGGGYGAESAEEGCGRRLLDACFEEVGGLEEECGDHTCAEAGEEVECRWSARDKGGRRMA